VLACHARAMDVEIDRWGEHGPRPKLNDDLNDLFGSMTASAKIRVDCSRREAWELLTSIERIGEFSPECVGAYWLDERAPAIGSRFEGRNRVVSEDAQFDWIRPCTVVSFDPLRRFAWEVGDRYDGTPAARWTFHVDGQAEGPVRIIQEFIHLPDGLSGIRARAEQDPPSAADLVASRQAALGSGMALTLERIKAVLEQRTH
jgi:hypothetical protein